MINTANLIPQKITIANFDINLYGIIIILSVLLLYDLSRDYLKKQDTSEDKLDTSFIIIFILGIIFGRIAYILFNPTQFAAQNFLYYLNISNGGIHLFGVIIGIILGIYISALFIPTKFSKLSDAIALFAPLAQALGRLANLVNLELFGPPTELPWAFFIPKEKRPTEFISNEGFHPTFLYESILNIVSFFIIWQIAKNKSIKPGIITAIYFLNYSIIRFTLEFLRLDLEPVLLGLKSTQYITIIVAVVAIIFLISKKSEKTRQFS